MKRSRIISLMLAFVLLLGLAACSSTSATNLVFGDSVKNSVVEKHEGYTVTRFPTWKFESATTSGFAAFEITNTSSTTQRYDFTFLFLDDSISNLSENDIDNHVVYEFNRGVFYVAPGEKHFGYCPIDVGIEYVDWTYLCEATPESDLMSVAKYFDIGIQNTGDKLIINAKYNSNLDLFEAGIYGLFLKDGLPVSFIFNPWIDVEEYGDSDTFEVEPFTNWDEKIDYDSYRIYVDAWAYAD